VLRKGLARELLSDGKIGEPSTHVGYEAAPLPSCTNSSRPFSARSTLRWKLSAPKQRADTGTVAAHVSISWRRLAS
jgi:hypothetical protein